MTINEHLDAMELFAHPMYMDKCFWCKQEFLDGEMMALAATEKGNKVLCQTCADKIESSDE